MGDHELGEGLKLAATAVTSAVLVAALVIAVGGALIERDLPEADPSHGAVLVQTGG